MFRLIRIIFNAFLLVLAIIGFNAIGGEKYIEAVKDTVVNFVQEHNVQNAKKIGDFSKINEEFQIDNTVNLMGYKAVIAEHKASGQKMLIIDSGKKPILTQEDIKSDGIDKKLKELSQKYKYQGVNINDIKITGRGNLNAYNQNVPYAKSEAHVTKLPISDIGGIVSSVQTSDSQEKLLVSVNDKKKYSQLITNEFYKSITESANN